MTIERLNEITSIIIQCAIEVHRVLGPGLLERVYLACLCYELRNRGLTLVAQRVLPIHYKDMVFDLGYRIDVLSCLRLADKRLGLLINFNVPVLVSGLKRTANKL